MEEALLRVYVFAIGAVVGSFANVCIHRLPRGESVVTPPSRCPACGTRIRARDNVPVFGWLILRGRCRDCAAPISARYPMVEALTGALFLAGYLRWGLGADAAAFALLAAASVILVGTDLESRVLPDEVTLPTLGFGLILAVARDLGDPGPFRFGASHLQSSLFGAALGAGLLLLARVSYKALRGVEGMGSGDVTMIAMIGSLTGPGGVLVTLFAGSLLGTLVGGAAIGVQRLRWWAERSRWRRAEPAAPGSGFLVLLAENGGVARAAPAFRLMPGAPPEGSPVAAATGVARRVAAFARLAQRRARNGQATEYARLHLDDGGDYFRVVSLRGEPLAGRLLILEARTDIPFGVFLALGSLLSLWAGRALLAALFQGATPGARLLP